MKIMVVLPFLGTLLFCFPLQQIYQNCSFSVTAREKKLWIWKHPFSLVSGREVGKLKLKEKINRSLHFSFGRKIKLIWEEGAAST